MPKAFLTEPPRRPAPQGRRGQAPRNPTPGVGQIPPGLRDEHPSIDLRDIVTWRSSLAGIHTLPDFSLGSPFPQAFTQESVNPDPLERRVLLAVIQEVIQRLRREFHGYKQFGRPPFQRLSAKLHVDRWRREMT